MQHPIKKNAFYDSFAVLYPEEGFLRAAKDSLKEEIIRLKKQILRTKIINIIKSIPGIELLYSTLLKRK